MVVRTFTASEVLDLLEDQELFEDVDYLVSSVDLDVEREDDDLPEGDGFGSDGSATLIPPEYLNPEATQLLAEGIGASTPAEKDSLLYSNSGEQDMASSDDDGK